MTTTQTQLRSGTAAACDAMTPVDGEPIFDTTNKRIRIGNGSTAGGLPMPTYLDDQRNSFTYCTVGGTANAITLTPTRGAVAYVAGQSFQFLCATDNTGAVTVNVSGLGAKSVKKLALAGTLMDLVAGDLQAGVIYTIAYDGVDFQLQGIASQTNTATGAMILLASQSGAASQYDFEGFFSSTYKSYKFIISNIRPSAPTSNNFFIRVKRNGQPNFDASGYTTSYAAGATEFNMLDGGFATIGNASQAGLAGEIFASDFNNGNRVMFVANGLTAEQVGGLPIALSGIAAYRDTLTALVGVRFAFNGTTIASGGRIDLYGIVA